MKKELFSFFGMTNYFRLFPQPITISSVLQGVTVKDAHDTMISGSTE